MPTVIEVNQQIPKNILLIRVFFHFLKYYTDSSVYTSEPPLQEHYMDNGNTIRVVSAHEAELLHVNSTYLNVTQDLIAIVGRDLKYYYVNPAYAAAHETSPDELTGRHIGSFIDPATVRNIIVPNLKRCLTGEEIRYEEWFSFNGRDRHYMQVVYHPLTDTEGQVDRILIITRDITADKTLNHLRAQSGMLLPVIDETLNVLNDSTHSTCRKKEADTDKNSSYITNKEYPSGLGGMLSRLRQSLTAFLLNDMDSEPESNG